MKEGIDRRKDEFEKSLKTLFNSLDRNHYPGELLESLAAVLFPDSALRTLPLLLRAEKDRTGGGCELAAAEIVFRGFLLLAELGRDPSGRIETGLAARLAAKYSEAHLLLTADTLLTWAMELAARGETVSAKHLDRAFGMQGALGKLDEGGELIEILAAIDPFYALIADRPEKTGVPAEALESASRFAWLAELESWFARPDYIADMLGKMDLSAGRQSPFGDLIEYIGRNR